MLYTAFILGLLGSLHCLGMCGPIALMLPIGQAKGAEKIFYISLYQLGRLLAYGILGAIFGVLGKGLALFGLQQKISIAIGLVMLFSVLVPWWFNKTRASKNWIVGAYHKWIFKVQGALGNALQKGGGDNFITIGFLNGFLPCGLVSMALLGTIASGSGQALEGVLYMVFFGLGTVPMMAGISVIGQKIQQHHRQKIRSYIPVFVGAIGLLFILRGLGLGIPYLSPKAHTEAGNAVIECHDLQVPGTQNTINNP